MIWFDDKGVDGNSGMVVMCVCACVICVCATYMNNEAIFYCFIIFLECYTKYHFFFFLVFSHSQSYRFFPSLGSCLYRNNVLCPRI